MRQTVPVSSAAAAPNDPTVRSSIADLVERARELAAVGGRRILGITGAPGAGKSTVTRAVVDALGPNVAVLVPMDGFHLANVTLINNGSRDRKGAWDTFDAAGYVHLLRRLRAADETVVHAPDFSRHLEESIGSAIPVPREIPLVVTEGNYLLSEQGNWAAVADLLHECWYLEVDDSLRQERLIARHESHGKSRTEAAAWTLGSDQANAELIAAGRDRADLIVCVTD